MDTLNSDAQLAPESLPVHPIDINRVRVTMSRRPYIEQLQTEE